MTLKFVSTFTTHLLLASILSACSPPLKSFQAAHPEKPCLQCSEIQVVKSCNSDLHNKKYKCIKPAIAYSLSPSGQCAQAQISCASPTFPPVEQSVMVVGKVNGDTNNDSNVYSPISSVSPNSMLLTLICNSESQWIMKSRDDNDLVQPLTVQCAYNAPNFKLPTLMDVEVAEEKPKTNETPKKSKKKKNKKSKKLVTEEPVNQTTTIQPEQKE